jgi:hypothetical protein
MMMLLNQSLSCVNYITAAIAEGLAERQAEKDEDDQGDTEESAEAKAARFEQKQMSDDRNKSARCARQLNAVYQVRVQVAEDQQLVVPGNCLINNE